jgi:Clp protease
VCVGQACSAAAVLLAAGEPGHRSALPNARILIHQPHGGAQGQSTDMEIQVREMVTMRERMVDILTERTNQTRERIEADIDRDYILRGEEAVAYGLVDEVIVPPRVGLGPGGGVVARLGGGLGRDDRGGPGLDHEHAAGLGPAVDRRQRPPARRTEVAVARPQDEERAGAHRVLRREQRHEDLIRARSALPARPQPRQQPGHVGAARPRRRRPPHHLHAASNAARVARQVVGGERRLLGPPPGLVVHEGRA